MKGNSNEEGQNAFVEIMRRAYEKGLADTEMTALDLIEDLKSDLKNMPIATSETI